MNIHFLDCFCTDEKNSGNRAAVITDFNDGLHDKQTIAKELNLPVTVFISSLNETSPTLDFFYPNCQMPLCLHGTIAAAKVFFINSNKKIVNFYTNMGKNYLTVTEEDDSIVVKVTKKESPIVDLNLPTICEMLGIPSTLINPLLPLQVASVGSPKLLIPLNTHKNLLVLKPDFSLITNWSIETKVNGLYVYSLLEKNIYSARAFNPKTGKNEDSATGVASAALSLVVKESILIKQGEFINTPCQIFNNYIDENTVLVGGKAHYISSNINS